MKRIGILGIFLALALFAPAAGHATPSGSHVITGAGTNTNLDTVSTFLVSELTQSGTVVVNGIPMTVICVAVNSGMAPGQHKVYIRASGGGAVAGIEIAESGGNQFMGLGLGPNPCGVSAPVSPVPPGSYLILP